MENFTTQGFQNVDRTGNAGAYVVYLDRAGGVPQLLAVKQRTYELLAPKPGAHFLDAGCGTGDDVRALGRLVAPGGQVTGIDASSAMIAEAAQRSVGSDPPVSFAVADVSALPYADGEFDGCRAERVLQHMEQPERGLAEMARVVRSGGRVVVFEPDWEMLVVDTNDATVTRAFRQAHTDMVACGDIGRRLYALFRDCGLGDVAIEPRTSILFDFASANLPCQFEVSVERAVTKGSITAERGAEWLRDLRERDRTGRFFVAITSFIASGTKPA